MAGKPLQGLSGIVVVLGDAYNTNEYQEYRFPRSSGISEKKLT